ncbi:MAG: homocysteine S-methyltransferase family protein, partial [Gemmatimonadota bacterium]
AAQIAREASDSAGRIATEAEKATHHLRNASSDSDLPVLVGGSVGPTGEMMEPLGTLSSGEAREGFATQARGLAEGGADLIWIETMSDLREAEAAIKGAQDACDLPLVVTLTFDAGGRTMMGVSPEQAVETLTPFGLAAVGANCGSGPEETEEVIATMASLGSGLPLIAKANAGKPAWVDGALVYDGTPEVMGEHALRVRDLGASLIGGCCGTTPAHIREMGRALADGPSPG